MTINWRQVLEIESFFNEIFEKNATLERLLWRNPQSVNSGIRVDKNLEYSIEDVHNYLISKYPKDEMIKNGGTVLGQLFDACYYGNKICDINPELLEINEFQEKFKLTDDVVKKNILYRCASSVGSTAFFLKLLQNIIHSHKSGHTLLEINQQAKEMLHSTLNQFEISKSEFSGAFDALNEQILAYMTGTRFRSFCISCEKNGYTIPYSTADSKLFLRDVLLFSKNAVHDIIDFDSNDFFAYKINHNKSLYPEDLRRTEYGDIDLFTTLKGLFNHDEIVAMKLNGELLGHIKWILSKDFEVLHKESVIDDNPNVIIRGNNLNSSLIIGKELTTKNLYNQFLNTYQNKLINGYIWHTDDLRGPIFSYLNFHTGSDLMGEYKYSMPLENAIPSYNIAYLERALIERNKEELMACGFFSSKEEFRSISNEDDEEFSNSEDDDELPF